MKKTAGNRTLLALVALLVGLLAAAPAAAAELGKQIRQLTGAETRIVWLNLKQWEAADPKTVGLDGDPGYSIMAFDTGGKGERELVPEGDIAAARS